MMKRISLLVVLFFNLNLYSQEIEYFPQEQIVVNGCENAQNKADCFYMFLEQKVSDFLIENQKGFKKLENDTLSLGGVFVINKDNKIDKAKSGFGIRVKKINKKIDEDFNSLFLNSPISQVINRKPSPFFSRHSLSFNYLVKKENKEIVFEFLPSKTPYSGGIVEEIARFPGCENLNESDARICFQKKLQEHIKHHFRYPKEAQEQNISGRVSIVFVISKDGDITNIRTRGPHTILEKDAIRIIEF